MVRVVEGSFTTLLLEEESVTTTVELAFAGNPAESSVSTSTVPVAEGLTSCEPGTGITFRRVARPLGFTVATWADAAVRPTEDAEIDVAPGVVLLVKFAATKPEPLRIVTLSETEPTPACDDVRKTRVSLTAREGFPVEVWRETTIAG